MKIALQFSLNSLPIEIIARPKVRHRNLNMTLITGRWTRFWADCDQQEIAVAGRPATKSGPSALRPVTAIYVYDPDGCTDGSFKGTSAYKRTTAKLAIPAN